MAAVAAGLALGAGYGVHAGMLASARQPIGTPRELPEVAVAPRTRPSARIGAVIEMTPYGYQPRIARVQVGEAVAFHNPGMAAQRPMNDPHPGHGGYSGLNAPGIVEPGGTWYAVLDDAGSFGVRDEVYPNATATVEAY